MVVFALSCFGLLLFLWLSFGGPVPLKPKGYRVQVAFPEATSSATEADVRIAGVSVGKVPQGRRRRRTATARSRRSSSTASSRRCTPTRGRSCARRRCSARPTSSSRPARASADDPRGRAAANGQVKPTGAARRDLRRAGPGHARRRSSGWQQELAKGIKGRGRDFNDALGTLPGFAADGADVLARARHRRRARCSGWSRTPAWCSPR